MDPRRRYTCKEVVKLLVDLPSDEELSEDDEECVSDNDDTVDGTTDSSIAVPADAALPADATTASSPDEISDSESDTLYQLADGSDSEDEYGLQQFTDESTQSSIHSDSDTTVDRDAEEPAWKKIPLTVNIGLNFDNIQVIPSMAIAGDEQPLEFFSRFMNDDVVHLLVFQTNLYAKQSQLKNWHDTSELEMKAFLGMLIAMGLHDLPRTELYWSSDPLFRVPAVAHIMPVKRFKKLREALHLNDNANAPKRNDPNYDKLYKLRPVMDKLNQCFQSQCIQTTSQSVDEGMIAFKGRSSLKQYMPLKPVKRGYKAWLRCDSKTGYAFQFQLYTGKSSDNITEVGLGTRVVTSLTDSLSDQNIHVTFDNFFTSYQLMEQLYCRGIYATATVRANRKDLPVIARSRPSLQRGEFKWRTQQNTAYVLWRDTKDVHVLSTAFIPSHTVQVDLCVTH